MRVTDISAELEFFVSIYVILSDSVAPEKPGSLMSQSLRW